MEPVPTVQDGLDHLLGYPAHQVEGAGGVAGLKAPISRENLELVYLPILISTAGRIPSITYMEIQSE